MPNKQSTKEWLKKSYHDLEGAIVLFNSNHYTDTIGYILQQSLEKLLKSILAYENRKINKTHNLVELYESISGKLKLDENDIKNLAIATTYNIKVRYPTPYKKMPKQEEIKEVLDFTEELFDKVCGILEIDKKEVMK